MNYLILIRYRGLICLISRQSGNPSQPRRDIQASSYKVKELSESYRNEGFFDSVVPEENKLPE